MLGYEVTRWHPFVFRGHRDFDAVLDRFLGRRESNEGWTPPMDAYASDGKYVIRLDLPGVDTEDLDVQVEGRVLTIRGDRKVETADHHLRETVHGKFERAVRLPNGVDADRVEARYRNGVVEVTAPLPAKPVGRKVPVRREGGEAGAVESHDG